MKIRDPAANTTSIVVIRGIAMDDRRLPSPQHQAVRSFLRIAGPVTALVGLIFLIVGMVSFFSSFGSFEPRACPECQPARLAG